jgi:uncharacterized protein YbjT (DUF2867 family)
MLARSCLIVGSTGLVGGHLLRLLLDDPNYRQVTALVRRPPFLTHDKLNIVICELDRPDTYAAHVPVDDVFCCLGTTIKKAGSQEAFRKVDFEYPVAVARASGAGQYLIVTAVGGDSKSSIFYNRVKGDVEATLREIPFPRGLKIFRPSMILGDRAESRPAERFAKAIMGGTAGLFIGGLKRYRAIDAAVIARAMLNAALREPDGNQIYEGASLFAMGEQR